MSAPRIVFVTGTDSGVGKTWVGCALARALLQSGHSVVAIKVVETGTEINPSASEDGVQLAAATGALAAAVKNSTWRTAPGSTTGVVTTRASVRSLNERVQWHTRQ